MLHSQKRVVQRAQSGALIVLSLALAACGSGGDKDASGGEAVATAGPDGWRITPEGFGPLRAGQSLAEASTAVGSPITLAAGASPDCSYAEWAAAPAGVRVMVERDTIARVEVVSGSVTTAEGAKIGDAEGRINSLYATRVMVGPHKYTTGKYMTAFAPPDTMHKIVFETDGQNVTMFRSGRMPAVEYVEGCG
jgi:hypothetical protein